MSMKRTEIIDEISESIALAGLKIGAIKIRPHNPFLWASGTYNPIYNDNRMYLYYPLLRKMIIEGFIEILALTKNRLYYGHTVIAGTSTAGISHGYGLAEAFPSPFVYVRDKPKDHGMRNQIEGIDAENDLTGEIIVLIEDLISTGGSSVAAVDALRKANGTCNLCLSIFNYGLPNPPKMFAGEIPYNTNGDKLISPCHVESLLYYPRLLEIGIENGFIKKEEEKILLEWMEDQPNWGEKNGFPTIKK